MRNNQLRRRNQNFPDQNSDSTPILSNVNNESNLSPEFQDAYNLHSQMYNAGRGNMPSGYSNTATHSKGSHLISKLSNLKINRFKKASKICVNTLKNKLNSFVQHPESSRVITAKEVSDSMSIDSIRSHNEFALLTENLLAWGGGNYISQFEGTNFTEIMPLTLFENQILNHHIALRLVDYMADIAECKKFTIKYIDWKLKFSKIPEEYILAVEYFGFCIKNLGSAFPIYITRSLMRTFAKLIDLKSFKHSFASGVRKQISKIISGTNPHPGVATDPRIHALRSKILFTIQLCHDAFLMQQSLYPNFFMEYRRMRAKGIKFPRIPPGSRYMVKGVEIITSYKELKFPLDMKILAEISSVVERISKGDNDESLRSTLTTGKAKILESINILSDISTQEFNNIPFIKEEKIEYESFMDKLFKLNDSIDDLLSNTPGAQDLLNLDSDYEPEEEEDDLTKELASIFGPPGNTTPAVSGNSSRALLFGLSTGSSDVVGGGDDDADDAEECSEGLESGNLASRHTPTPSDEDDWFRDVYPQDQEQENSDDEAISGNLGSHLPPLSEEGSLDQGPTLKSDQPQDTEQEGAGVPPASREDILKKLDQLQSEL